MVGYDYFDKIIEHTLLSPAIHKDRDHTGRNLYTFEDNGKQLLLCHVPTFLPYSRIDDDGVRIPHISDHMGFGPSAVAVMAMHHWNNGNGVIVKDIDGINEFCPMRFTTEIFDTIESPVQAIEDFIDVVSRSPSDHTDGQVQPCAVLGTFFSHVTTKLALLTGVYEVLQVSPAAPTVKLTKDRENFPFFARTHPSADVPGMYAYDYVQMLGVRRFAVVFVDDEYAKTYSDVVNDLSRDSTMISFPVQIANDLNSNDAKRNLRRQFRRLKEQRINYFIGAFYGEQFDTVMEVAFEEGIAGPDNFWIFSELLDLDLFFESKTFPRHSSLAKATFGNAVLVDKGGVSGVARYDAFLKEWSKMSESTSTSFLDYIISKQPTIFKDHRNYSQHADVFQKLPNAIEIYSYEAIIALGLSACNVIQKNVRSFSNDVLISSKDHFRALVSDLNFMGPSGNVTFAPNTTSREGSDIQYVIANVITNEAESNRTHVTLQGIEYAYGRDWDLYGNGRFIYPGNKTSPPDEYIPLPIHVYVVIGIVLWVVLVALTFICLCKLRKITLPSAKLVFTKEIPNIKLPEGKSYHIFMSHVWRSGQGQTHAIVRQMQLYLPGIKVWLDVDELEDIDDLEYSIERSAVFVLFYSEGYFASKNCRREIYCAIKLNKPIILVYEGDESVIEALMVECETHCLGLEFDTPTSERIRAKLLGDESISDNNILWLKERRFSAVSLNLIYTALLRHLPYYEMHPHELDQGLTVPHEQQPVSLTEPVYVLVHGENKGGVEVADELKSFNTCEGGEEIIIIDTEVLFRSNYSAHLSLDEFNESLFESYPRCADCRSYFLLYLNNDTFNHDITDNEMKLCTILKFCVSMDIKILLVQEKDLSKGACRISTLISNVPAQLLCPPINLFHEIATPLYSHEQYRDVSMRLLLVKMGGNVAENLSGKWKLVERFNKALGIRNKEFQERMSFSSKKYAKQNLFENE